MNRISGKSQELQAIVQDPRIECFQTAVGLSTIQSTIHPQINCGTIHKFIHKTGSRALWSQKWLNKTTQEVAPSFLDIEKNRPDFPRYRITDPPPLEFCQGRR